MATETAGGCHDIRKVIPSPCFIPPSCWDGGEEGRGAGGGGGGGEEK